MSGITALQQRWTPRTFTSSTRHHSFGSSSQVGPSGPPMPALATRRSIGPSSLSAWMAIASTEARSLTSTSSGTPPISRATCSTCARVRAATATRAPASASSRAIPAPIPRPPPVTSATCPSRRSAGCDMFDLLQGLGVLQRREVAGVGAERLRADGSADDLRAAGLRQGRYEQHPLGRERLAELARGEPAQLGCELVARLDAGHERAEDPGHLALHLVR